MSIKIHQPLALVFSFSILLLLLLFAGRMSEFMLFANWGEVLQSAQYFVAFFIRALRFDIKYLSTLLLLFAWIPLIVFALFPAGWFSTYLRWAFSLLLVLTCYIVFIDIGYMYYFQKPIDVLIFGFLEDDTNAIMAIMLSNYRLIGLFILFCLFSYVLVTLFLSLSRNLSPENTVQPSRKKQFLTWFFSFLLLVVLARGSLDTFPLQRKHASVSDNNFLNSLVMNSPFNVYYAFSDKKVNNQAVFKQDLLKLNDLTSLKQLEEKAGYDEDHLRVKTPESVLLDQLKPHVIVVQMESWSSQIARKNSPRNNVLGDFAQHAAQDHFYTHFFSNQYATNPTIEGLLLNSPITPLSQSIASKTHFKLSNILPFKRKGYTTQFLSGGYSSWRNHSQFWPAQGFDRYIGRSTIESTYQVDASDNPWGVYEEYVFKYLEKTLEEAESAGESLFSFVLTTNNHPPVRLPDNVRIPELQPEAYGYAPDNNEIRQILSGYYYQTDQLGRFISWVKQSDFKNRVIIMATGDHPLRHFVKKPSLKDLFNIHAVATYFYVPESLDKLVGTPDNLVGSHYDLFPTLFELSLSNASYYSFGQSLMEKSTESEYGWSTGGKFIFSDGVADTQTQQFYRWENAEKSLLNPRPLPLDAAKKQSVEKEKYRTILKKYLLVEDYKATDKSAK